MCNSQYHVGDVFFPVAANAAVAGIKDSKFLHGEKCRSKKRRWPGRFRSLDGLRMTDGELSIDLWEQAVSGTCR